MATWLPGFSKTLFAPNRLEQRLEIPLAETPRSAPLDDLEEQRRPILDGLREYLQHVAFVVAVDEDAEFRQVADVLVDLAHTVRQDVVVRLRHPQEGHVV